MSRAFYPARIAVWLVPATGHGTTDRQAYCGRACVNIIVRGRGKAVGISNDAYAGFNFRWKRAGWIARQFSCADNAEQNMQAIESLDTARAA